MTSTVFGFPAWVPVANTPAEDEEVEVEEPVEVEKPVVGKRKFVVYPGASTVFGYPLVPVIQHAPFRFFPVVSAPKPENVVPDAPEVEEEGSIVA